MFVLKLTSENAELERQVSMGLQTQRELVEEVSKIEPLQNDTLLPMYTLQCIARRFGHNMTLRFHLIRRLHFNEVIFQS